MIKVRSGVAGPSSSAPFTQYTNSPLALAQFNTLHLGATSTVNWSFPASVSGGASLTAAQTYYSTRGGGYFIFAGGNNGGSTFYNTVFTIAYDGAGNLAQAVPQPALPTTNAGNTVLCASTDPSSGDATVVIAGGSQVSGSLTNAVYVAQFDPTTGSLASWSSQATLPQAIQDPGMAAYNGFVFVVGGASTLGLSTVNTVSVGQVQNGQIAAWTATTPLPVAMMNPFVAALDGFLVVFGGFTGSVNVSTTYYAPIHADGSLGTWQTGPALPTALSSVAVPPLTVGSYGMIGTETGPNLVMLGAGVNGLDVGWQAASVPSNGVYPGLAVSGAGQFQYYSVGTSGGSPVSQNYLTAPISLTPRISIPLPATGLTNSATYHLLLQQPNGTLSDYLRLHDDFDAFPGNPTVLTRAKGSTTWTAGTTGHAVPIQIYDNTAGGQPWHVWSDGGARIGTLVHSTTPDQRLIGILDATAQPGPVLNQWPTFSQGVGPWHPTGGTFTQSNAFTHGNLPFSGLLTPSGLATLSYVESDLVAVQQGHSYVLTALYYSPTGYSNVAVSANWFDINRNYLSTTSGTATAISAGTWTKFVTTVTANVANAVYVDMVCVEGGTPPSSALLYVSTATVQDTSGPQVSSVAQVTWNGSWPSPIAPVTGVTVLA